MIVKNRKSEFKPIIRIGDKQCIVRWDLKPVTILNKEGIEVETPLATWQEEHFDFIPSMDEIKDLILCFYDKETSNEIIGSFKWNGMKVWLSTENQFNYKSIYDVAIQTNGKNLPVTMKFGETSNPIYYKFETMEELSKFYFDSLNHVQKTLQKGWEIKDNIDWELYQ